MVEIFGAEHKVRNRAVIFAKIIVRVNGAPIEKREDIEVEIG